MITETKIILSREEAEHELAKHFAAEKGVPNDHRLQVSISEPLTKRYPGGIERIRAIKWLREEGAWLLRPSNGSNYVGLKDAKDAIEKIIAIFEGKGA